MQDRFALMLGMQKDLQQSMPDARDIMEIQGDERAAVIRNMVLATEDELHEAMNEAGWKPWATSRHLNGEAFIKEMVDAWHFFMNLLLIAAGEMGWSTEQLADEFTRQYIAKNVVNRQRQVDGYDGVSSKCPTCKRELSETESSYHVTHRSMTFCSSVCAVAHG